eukprot:13750882-Alexandrium_andersonii.AAC.1
MSASLVGSEMCIRDRHKGAVAARDDTSAGSEWACRGNSESCECSERTSASSSSKASRAKNCTGAIDEDKASGVGGSSSL